MKITLVTVGKIKEKFYSDAIGEYVKRLSRYCKLTITETADEKTPDGASAALENQILEKEGLRILKSIPSDGYVIALAIDGKKMDSIQFSEVIGNAQNTGKSHLVFLIGGSLGLSKQVLDEADLKVSFSDLTFPHQLMRVILLEQIYRGYRILKNEPYHK